MHKVAWHASLLLLLALLLLLLLLSQATAMMAIHAQPRPVRLY
jgi:hypothetical protein